MMKKLLCMVLALALLCGSAMAEANQTVVTFSTNTTQLVALLTQAGVSENVTLLAQGLKELLTQLRLEFHEQDEALWGSISLDDTVLVDLAYLYNDEGLMQMATSLLPQHYIAYQRTEEEIAQCVAAFNVMISTDWNTVADELAVALQTWWKGLPCQESTGRFVGDAYTDGSFCVTRSFDDADVACAVDMLSAVLQQHGVDDSFLEAYLGQENLWQSVQTANQTIAQANRYGYTVKQVYGETGELMGLSFIVMEGENQVMTASLGMNETGWKLVLGWGKDQRNYYLCFEAFPGESATDWMAMMYQDPQRLGFSMTETLPSYLLWLAGGSLTQQSEGNWRLDMELLDLYASNTLLEDLFVRIDASETAEGAVLDVSLYLPDGDEGVAEEPVFGVNLTVQPTSERIWSMEGKQPLDIEDIYALDAETEAVLEQEIQRSVDDLFVQLLKLLPTQLLIFLMQ